MSDINVAIGLDTKAPPRETLLPLILSTEGEKEYTEYNGPDALLADFPVNTPTYRKGHTLFMQPNPEGIAETVSVLGVSPTATPEEMIAALDDHRQENDDFFFVMVTSMEPEVLNALGDWAAATVKTINEIKSGVIDDEKLFLAQTDDPDFRLTQAQTVLCYNPDAASSDMEAAWVGRVAPYYPLNADWKFKDLNTVPIVKARGTNIVQLTQEKVNTYVLRNKREYMVEGVCANGDFIDIIISRAKLKRAMKRKVTDLYADSRIVTYGDDGFTLIGKSIIAALDEGVTNEDILTMDSRAQYTISIPRRVDATPEQVEKRIMPPIRWKATLAGSVHSVDVYGILSIQLIKQDAE